VDDAGFEDVSEMAARPALVSTIFWLKKAELWYRITQIWSGREAGRRRPGAWLSPSRRENCSRRAGRGPQRRGTGAGLLGARQIRRLCLLFSFVNPAHEKAIARAFSPDFQVSVSHEILPEYREFERTSRQWSCLPRSSDEPLSREIERHA